MNVPLPELKPGIYNVIWVNISRIDGHELRGSYPFTVLNPDGSVPAGTNQVTGFSSDADPPPVTDGVAVRALSLLGLTIVVGGRASRAALGRYAARPPGAGSNARSTLARPFSDAATLLNLATIRHAYTSDGLTELILPHAFGRVLADAARRGAAHRGGRDVLRRKRQSAPRRRCLRSPASISGRTRPPAMQPRAAAAPGHAASTSSTAPRHCCGLAPSSASP